MSKVFYAAIWLLFIVGLVGCMGGHFVVHEIYLVHSWHLKTQDKGKYQNYITYGGTALAVVMGTLVASREPVKSFLQKKAVLGFLFLFNLSVAVVVPFAVHGKQGLYAAVGLGVVAIGAGFGLLKSLRGAPAHAQH